MRDEGLGYSGPDSTGFYAYSDWQRLKEVRSEQEFCLLKRIQAGSVDARGELTMHREEDDVLQDRASSAGYDWVGQR